MNFLRYQIQEQWETWHFWNIQYVTYSRTLIQIWTRKTWEFSSSFALLPTILNWHLVIKGSEINSTLSWMTYPPGRSVRRVVPYDHSMILLLFCLSILGHIFFLSVQLNFGFVSTDFYQNRFRSNHSWMNHSWKISSYIWLQVFFVWESTDFVN